MSWSPTANAVNNHLGCLISIQLTFGKKPHGNCVPSIRSSNRIKTYQM